MINNAIFERKHKMICSWVVNIHVYTDEEKTFCRNEMCGSQEKISLLK